MGPTVEISHIISEIARERCTTPSRKVLQDYISVLEESWEALNNWIFSRFSRRKGVSIPSLMLVTWEFLEASDEKMVARPVFFLTEAFYRSMRIEKKTNLPPKCAPCEEVNYTSLAIKFSKTLTKDVTFTSIKDITRKIADHVACGHTVDLTFRIGSFRAKHRKVQFLFDQSTTSGAGDRRGATISSTTNASTAVRSPDVDSGNDGCAHPDSARSTGSAGSGRVRRDGNYDGTATTDNNSTSRELLGSTFTRAADNCLTATTRLPPQPYDNEGGATVRDASSYSLKDELAGDTKGNAILNQAFVRYIEDLESGAAAQNREDQAIAANLEAVDQELQHRMETYKSQQRDLQKYIKSQMAEKKDAKERMAMQARSEVPNMTPMGILNKHGNITDSIPYGRGVREGDTMPIPPKMSPRSNEVWRLRNHITKFEGVPLRGKPRNMLNRTELLGHLKHQITSNEERTKRDRTEELSEEKRYNEYTRMEADLKTRAERNADLRNQRDLLVAWERDQHLKNLKKLQNAGQKAVADYARTVLVDQGTTMQKSAIGFDSR